MSKGLGTVERRILAAMPTDSRGAGEWRRLKVLKILVWGQQENHVRGGRPITLRYWQDGEANHDYSFRCALDRLAEKGLLEMRTERWGTIRKFPVRLYRITQAGKCALSKVHTYAKPADVTTPLVQTTEATR